MAQKTYRQFVNKAILESGTTLSDIGTGSSFTSPSDRLHEKFKGWVADAWKEIQMEHGEFEFTQKQASILINPRVYVEQIAGTTTPAAADILVGDDTLTSTRIANNLTLSAADIHLLSGAWGSTTAKAYIGFDWGAAQSTVGQYYKLNEKIDHNDSSNDPLVANAMRVKGIGRYSLTTEISDLLEPRLDTFWLQSPGGSGVTANNDAVNSAIRLAHYPWDRWNYNTGVINKSIGTPSCFTQAPNGHIEFDRIPDTQYILNLHYEAEPQVLSTETEVLSAPLEEFYEDIIVWKAVMHYADYDRKPEVFMRARKRYEWYLGRLFNKKLPNVGFSPNIFVGGY